MKDLNELLRSAKQAGSAAEKNSKLNEIFEQYGNAEIISASAAIFNLKENIRLFENVEIMKCANRKIKTIGTYYPKLCNGGLPRVLASLLCLWTEMGYNIVLYTDWEENKEDYYYPKTVKRIIVPDTDEVYSRCLFWKRSLLENQVDIMIEHNWMRASLIWDVLLIKSLHIPFVLYTHEHFTAFYENLYEYTMSSHRVFVLCDMVLSLAECNARFYELCGCNSRLIANPIAPELLNDIQPATLDSKTVLWIGRICDGKHPNDAIEILERVLRRVPDAELVFVGNGTERDMRTLHKRCEQKKILEHVRFEGFQINVAPYYRQAGLMLMTSEKEGYPTVVLESKAYGLPIVMYELPYLTLTKDRKGIVPIQMGDIDAAAEAVSEILIDSNRRTRLGQEASESFQVLKQVDLSIEWKNIFDSFQHALKEKKVSTIEDLILFPLLDQLEIAFERSRLTSLDYKVGNVMLWVPRNIYYLIRKCKRKLNTFLIRKHI